jgi:hypothetical protein
LATSFEQRKCEVHFVCHSLIHQDVKQQGHYQCPISFKGPMAATIFLHVKAWTSKTLNFMDMMPTDN